MVDVRNRKRQPEGIPTGGQFAKESHKRSSTSSDDRQAEVKALLTSLEDQIKNVKTQQDLDAFLEMAAGMNGYSFRNWLLIRQQCPNALMVGSYKKWQEKGYPVNKGEHGIKILAPMLVVDKDADVPPDEDPPRKLIGYRTVHVFDISQTSAADANIGQSIPSIRLGLNVFDLIFQRCK